MALDQQIRVSLELPDLTQCNSTRTKPMKLFDATGRWLQLASIPGDQSHKTYRLESKTSSGTCSLLVRSQNLLTQRI
jgi:hypothetical protein